jgi:Putative zinc-finger
MCKDPIDLETLVAWWLGELAAEREAPLEEHLFACAHCAGQLEWLAALSDGVRDAVRAGAIGLFVSAPFVEAMKRAGLRVREYEIDPGGSVNCTILADEDAVVARLRAPLAGVQRLRAMKHLSVGGDENEAPMDDLPFDAASGEVLFIPSAAWLKQMPAHLGRVQLFAVGEAGEALLGEYTFRHTPSD